jgi:hypothetical protein
LSLLISCVNCKICRAFYMSLQWTFNKQKTQTAQGTVSCDRGKLVVLICQLLSFLFDIISIYIIFYYVETIFCIISSTFSEFFSDHSSMSYICHILSHLICLLSLDCGIWQTLEMLWSRFKLRFLITKSLALVYTIIVYF